LGSAHELLRDEPRAAFDHCGRKGVSAAFDILENVDHVGEAGPVENVLEGVLVNSLQVLEVTRSVVDVRFIRGSSIWLIIGGSTCCPC
jgi:hypothetical protein